jgi:hypothetical protein
MATWITFKNDLLEGGLPQNRETMAPQKLTSLSTWQHFLLGSFHGDEVSWTTSNPHTRNLAFTDLQLEASFKNRFSILSVITTIVGNNLFLD